MNSRNFVNLSYWTTQQTSNFRFKVYPCLLFSASRPAQSFRLLLSQMNRFPWRTPSLQPKQTHPSQAPKPNIVNRIPATTIAPIPLPRYSWQCVPTNRVFCAKFRNILPFLIRKRLHFQINFKTATSRRSQNLNNSFARIISPAR